MLPSKAQQVPPWGPGTLGGETTAQSWCGGFSLNPQLGLGQANAPLLSWGPDSHRGLVCEVPESGVGLGPPKPRSPGDGPGC